MLPSKAIKILKAFQEATQWDESGEVVLRSGNDTARVFFAGGKIAWATVSSIKRTFTAYLVEAAKLDEDAVKEVFEDCKRTGKNFGETIVEWGLLDEASLRRLLLQQISECILEVFVWPSVESLFMPEHRAYKGSLTFDPPEVLQQVIALDVARRLPFHDATVEEILGETASFSGELDAVTTKPFLPSITPDPEKAAQLQPKKRSRLVFMVVLLVLLAGSAVASFLLWDKIFPPDESEPGGPAALGPPVPLGPSKAAAPDASVDGALEEAGEVPDAGVVAPEAVASADAGVDAGAAADTGAADLSQGADAGAPATQTHPVPGRIVALAEGEGQGSIQVSSTPSRATIFLDGIATGKLTPFLLAQVPAGRDHVVLVEKKGLSPAYLRLAVEKDKTASANLVLPKEGKPWAGRVVVRVESDPPGASVSLDGKPFKQLTPVEIGLPAGKVSKLSIKRDGFHPWVHNVRPVPDLEFTIFAKLHKKK